ncbi:hypothetical protein [Brachyspira hyodysenteriae]|uniref:hypothetical protein n=1 Tax=Brachyspira hyodysenteriae TaxID=159 RepID=UPI0022CDD11E|nr:hypothetical protein [Brachyspira hyodysenteriae]MCZ9888982.1 hypothetical protein [Brachyspira hyodysenteriae]
MGYLYSKPKPLFINHSIIEDADGNKIDLNNLNGTELNNNIIKCLSRRIDFLENRVDFLEENQEKILKLLIDTINTDIKSIEHQSKTSNNLGENQEKILKLLIDTINADIKSIEHQSGTSRFIDKSPYVVNKTSDSVVDTINKGFDMIKEKIDSIVESAKNLDNISEKFDANINTINKIADISLKPEMDNIEADINFIDKAKKVIENIEFPSLDKRRK